MLKKNLSIIFIVILFILSALFIVPHDKVYKVDNVISPVSFIINGEKFELNDVDCFDDRFTLKNKQLAKKLNITEEEAFIFGNLGKYWTKNIMQGRSVYINGNKDLVYYKYSYLQKFLYSGFCLKDSKPYFPEAFDKKLKEIRRAHYQVLDLKTDKLYKISDSEVKNLEDFIIIRKSYVRFNHNTPAKIILPPKKILDKGIIKIFFADSTVKFKPDRNCSSDICKEILKNINQAQSTIDMAIYGYSRVPEVEDALNRAINRGVKIRLVYDLDASGKNIYPDTDRIVKLLQNNISDYISADSKYIMHNKFYIFDEKVLITGSANLSHTDMSGFNSNSIVVIESPTAAKIYKKEFEQMYSGKFHSSKAIISDKHLNINEINLDIYFSPQDKSITNAILPVIRNAKRYIYIPTFLLTESRVVDELVKAKNRGVDVKIIIDALNASCKHSKHRELRIAGIPVKTENYAGKMHSKSMIVDDEITVIGSMNFSYSGENRNDENLVVIKDSAITKFYKDFFLYQWSKIDDKWLKYNARAEGRDSIGSCEDGIDNNYDGLTDSEDPACRN